MIIFTEHNEVVMSVSDMRELIRTAYFEGFDRSEGIREIPASLMVERTVAEMEKYMRQTQHVPLFWEVK